MGFVSFLALVEREGRASGEQSRLRRPSGVSGREVTTWSDHMV